MSLILINSGELLITLRDDWLRLRTESLKFSGLAKIFEGIFPFPAAAVSAEVWRTEVLQKKKPVSSFCHHKAGPHLGRVLGLIVAWLSRGLVSM